jgi:hypothetical protein
MPGVFQKIEPPPPSLPGECVPPAYGAWGGHTRWVERGVGGQYFGRRRYSSVLYICKYFVLFAFAGSMCSVPEGEVGQQLLPTLFLLTYSARSQPEAKFMNVQFR